MADLFRNDTNQKKMDKLRLKWAFANFDKTPSIDAQQNIIGHCACGRPNNKFKMNKQYCSRYCFLFMNNPAEDDPNKTMYEAWRGTGKYAYNPPYPKVYAACSWCSEDFNLGRGLKQANKHFCGNHCQQQANRSARSTSTRTGSKKVGDRVRIMRILREFVNHPLTASEVSSCWNQWFGSSCSAHKSANLLKILTAKGFVMKIKRGTELATYYSLNNDESLKSMFGESEVSRAIIG
jgi:hypothetical protein